MSQEYNPGLIEEVRGKALCDFWKILIQPGLKYPTAFFTTIFTLVLVIVLIELVIILLGAFR